MALRPWSPIPIADNGEPLLPLPAELLRLEPHPYVAVGAPYGSCGSPFRLRQGVMERLLQAQRQLQRTQPGWRLAVFDAWRPLAVQRFMVEHTIAEQCAALGLDPRRPSAALDAVVAEVGRFWAPPSEDAATPPPHSTGAAVDLTLADAAGAPIAMGSAIDAIGAVSEPDHYRALADGLPDGEARRQALAWHGHRQLLAVAMVAAGFAQHPNEWWHFSWGDQLWAWRSGEPQACYGRWLGD
ncbi:MAG: M15 family metallopeptidase [Cyanobium sp.]